MKGWVLWTVPGIPALKESAFRLCLVLLENEMPVAWICGLSLPAVEPQEDLITSFFIVVKEEILLQPPVNSYFPSYKIEYTATQRARYRHQTLCFPFICFRDSADLFRCEKYVCYLLQINGDINEM